MLRVPLLPRCLVLRQAGQLLLQEGLRQVGGVVWGWCCLGVVLFGGGVVWGERVFRGGLFGRGLFGGGCLGGEGVWRGVV